MTVRVLIVDGTPAAPQDHLVRHGGARVADNYEAALRSALPSECRHLDCCVLAAGDGAALPQGVALSDFHGIAWTGSPFGAYETRPEVAHQIGLARAAFQSGVPCFGSCWGLQVMAVALGGRVAPHPRGFEIGVARQIMLTDAGRQHAMYDGKAGAFDALCIHQDEVCALPKGGRVLAGNAFSAVQAVEFAVGDCSFWGVQYHPEFDLRQIAAFFRARPERLVELGFAAAPAVVDAIVDDFNALDGAIGRKDLAWRYGIGPDILDQAQRRREFTNWLRAKVLPYAAPRGA